MDNIVKSFFSIAEKFPKKTAVLVKRNGKYISISYEDLAGMVKKFSAGLRSLGVKKGDRVAILSENRPEWAIFDFGAMAAGAIVVPLHATFSPAAIFSILLHAEPKILAVSGKEMFEKISSRLSELNFLEKIIIFDPGRVEGEKIISMDDFLNSSREPFYSAILNPDDICSIIYTSGTTGIPKGVILTHNNFLSNIAAIKEAVLVEESDVFLSFLPLSHVLERTAGHFLPFLTGSAVAYAEGIKQLSLNLKEVRPTILISVPRIFEKTYEKIWEKINESPLKKKIFLWAMKRNKSGFLAWLADILAFRKIKEQMGGKIRLAVSGGTALDENIAKFFYKIGILILEGYGLTETSPVISVNREKEFKFGKVGKPVSGVEVKISEDKEILARGPNVTQGYFKNLEETKNAIDEDGWFHTGDLGFLDSEGYLAIIGRKKEMIATSGGKKVWPEAIEKALNQDKLILQSCVVGNSRKFVSAILVPNWEEVEKIFVPRGENLELKKSIAENPKIIEIFQKAIGKANENFSDFEKIKKFILLAEEFSQEKEELTPTLKLRHNFIEKKYSKEIDEMYK